jgi:hypothetical protein
MNKRQWVCSASAGDTADSILVTWFRSGGFRYDRMDFDDYDYCVLHTLP